MPEENFTPIVKMFLDGIRKLGEGLSLLDQFLQPLVLSAENLGQGLAACTSLAKHEGFPRGHIQLHRTNSGPVLSSVVLLFHQQKQLIEAPKGSAVLVVVISQWLL